MGAARRCGGAAMLATAPGLVVGVLVGWLVGGGLTTAATPVAGGPAATATRAAELDELSRLRTQVAQPPPICTPAATATPTATPTPVPPVAAGQPVPYADDWTLTVRDATTAEEFGGMQAVGRFVRIDLTIVNGGPEGRRFPFGDLALLAGDGRVFEPSSDATIRAGTSWLMSFPPSLPTEAAVVFDVADDVGESFVLQSRDDPTFRVAVALVQRG
jgi:hypothetical protein